MRFPTISDFSLGQSATFEKTFSEEDLRHFIAITGDTNPLHVDDGFAAQTIFGRRVVHGMLSASLFSTMVGMLLPGTGAIYRSQSLEFLAPVHLEDRLTVYFEVVGLDPAKQILELATWIDNQDGRRVVDGRATVGLLRNPPIEKDFEK